MSRPSRFSKVDSGGDGAAPGREPPTRIRGSDRVRKRSVPRAGYERCLFGELAQIRWIFNIIFLYFFKKFKKIARARPAVPPPPTLSYFYTIKGKKKWKYKKYIRVKIKKTFEFLHSVRRQIQFGLVKRSGRGVEKVIFRAEGGNSLMQ